MGVSSLPPWLGFIVSALHAVRRQCTNLAEVSLLLQAQAQGATVNPQQPPAPTSGITRYQHPKTGHLGAAAAGRGAPATKLMFSNKQKFRGKDKLSAHLCVSGGEGHAKSRDVRVQVAASHCI